MRFQDWDVLLFPGGEDKAVTHIPFREFRTSCYVEHDANGTQPPTPLLNTFVPSLPRGAPFQISLHSWTPTKSVLSPLVPGGVKPKEMWQVVLVVDGVKVVEKVFEVEEKWPQIMDKTTPNATGQAEDQLKFPRFHRIITGQNHWDAADLLGRIRLELSSGYADRKNNDRFVKVHNVVNFAFQPAPIELLEQTAIAWPNQRMYMIPLHTNPYGRMPATMKHRRATSINPTIAPSTAAWPGPAIPRYPAADSDTSSRSSSLYSILNDSAAPLLPPKGPAMPMFTGGYPQNISNDPSLQLRLPSDQLNMILNALGPNQQPAHEPLQAPVASTTMPPPPLPAHAMVSKATNFPELHEMPSPSSSSPQHPSDMHKVPSRREQSHYSDISMHAACTDFPSCTSEDANGRIVHTAPTAPAETVKGKKEGSGPAKRKYSRTYVVAKEDEPAEKRVRRSPRLLQHDSGYGGDGSIPNGASTDAQRHSDDEPREGGLGDTIFVKPARRELQ